MRKENKPIGNFLFTLGICVTLAGIGLFFLEIGKEYSYAGKGRLLSKESYSELFAEQVGNKNFNDWGDGSNPLDDEYNTGIFMYLTPTGNIGHTGSDPGVFGYMFFNPTTGIGKMVFANTSINRESWKKKIDPINMALDEYEDLIEK